LYSGIQHYDFYFAKYQNIYLQMI